MSLFKLSNIFSLNDGLFQSLGTNCLKKYILLDILPSLAYYESTLKKSKESKRVLFYE